MYSKKAEFHCHSSFSQKTYRFAPFLVDSVQTVEQILRTCIQKQIEIVCISDHDNVSGSLYAQELVQQHKWPLLVIPGAEVTTNTGHILALGITKNIPKHLPPTKVIDLIHKQNGLAIAAHPFNPVMGFGKQIFSLNLDGIEGFNACMPRIINQPAIKAAQLLGLPSIAASDAHESNSLGNGSTLFSSKVTTVSDVLAAIKAHDFSIACKKTTLRSTVLAHLAQADYGRLKGRFASTLQ